MGRIDEALRRTTTVRRFPREAPEQDAFVSAWSWKDEPRSTGRSPVSHPAPVERTAEERSDVGPATQVVATPTLLDRLKPEWHDLIVGSPSADRGFTEQYRRLAATLLQAQRVDEINSVLITSAVPGDGKTMTALNLALVMSSSYARRVLLIESDLRSPAITEALGLTALEGLAVAIRRNDERKIALVHLSDTLSLLPAGRPDSDPLGGLTSPRFQQLLQEAKERYDWVILDAPPVTAAADAGLLAPLVDGVLLVIRAERTPAKAIKRAVELLGVEKIIGVVLNAVEEETVPEYGNYYYSGTLGPTTD